MICNEPNFDYNKYYHIILYSYYSIIIKLQLL